MLKFIGSEFAINYALEVDSLFGAVSGGCHCCLLIFVERLCDCFTRTQNLYDYFFLTGDFVPVFNKLSLRCVRHISFAKSPGFLLFLRDAGLMLFQMGFIVF